MGEGTGGRGLGETVDTVGWVGRDSMGGWKVDKMERWGQAVRNSSAVGMSSSRVNEESSLQARVPVDCCWRTVVSSLSSSEGKKSDSGWCSGVLGEDLGCKGSHQLELFEVEMVVVHEGMTLVVKLDLLLRLVLGKGQAQPLIKSLRYEEGLHLVGSRGSYTRDFLGKGRGFKGTS